MNTKKNRLIYALLILAAVVALCAIWFAGKSNADKNFGNENLEIVNGTGQGFGGEITATVSYEYGKIVDLQLVGLKETPEIGGEALKTISLNVLDKGTTQGVDAVSGATYTSAGAFEAIDDALTKLRLRY